MKIWIGLFLLIFLVGCQTVTNSCIESAKNLDAFESGGDFNTSLEFGGVLNDYYESYTGSWPAEGDMYYLFIKPTNKSYEYYYYPNSSENFIRSKYYKFSLQKHPETKVFLIQNIHEAPECNQNKVYDTFRKSSVNYTETYFCKEDSDCIIKTNRVNCAIATDKRDTSEYKESIPPSHTTCPQEDRILAKCDLGKCQVAYDCSQCDSLKTEMEFCSVPHPSPLTSWICEMYKECNC